MLQAELTAPLSLLSKPLAPAPSGELHHCQPLCHLTLKPYCIPTQTTMASTMQGMWIQIPTTDSCYSLAGHQQDQKPASYLLADTCVCPHRWAHTASHSSMLPVRIWERWYLRPDCPQHCLTLEHHDALARCPATDPQSCGAQPKSQGSEVSPGG